MLHRLEAVMRPFLSRKESGTLILHNISTAGPYSMNLKHDDENWTEETVEIPIDGVLDLHTFRPDEISELVPDYIECCLEEGITEIRIIHGKGKGVLRQIVRSILDHHPAVLKYGTPSDASSWGATVAELQLPDEEES